MSREVRWFSRAGDSSCRQPDHPGGESRPSSWYHSPSDLKRQRATSSERRGTGFPTPCFYITMKRRPQGLPGGSDSQESAHSTEDPGLIPESGRSPGEGNGSILAWRVPWTEEPGKLWSIGSQRVGHKWETNTLHLLWKSIYYRASQVALVVKNATANAGDIKRLGFDPWVGKTPWKREWHPTPVFLPGESHGQRSLVNYSPWGHKESDTTEAT